MGVQMPQKGKWHFSDTTFVPVDVRSQGHSGKHLLAAGISHFDPFETSASDANGQTVVWVYARQNEAEAAPALSDLAHKQVRSKKAKCPLRAVIVPRLTKGNGHDRFSYRQGRSNDFR
jgi:hypothetical protein